VVARICASTFAGMYLIWSGSICSLRDTGAAPLSPPTAIAATRPDLDTPQLDLGVGLHHQARPVPTSMWTGTSDRKVPANSA